MTAGMWKKSSAMLNRIKPPVILHLFACWVFLFFPQINLGQEAVRIGGVGDFEIDPLGNCYYRIKDDIIKADRSGRELTRYSRRDLGTPTSFDVSNPLRILVFYAPFAKIRILDNNLIDQSEIDLRSMGIIQPKVIAGTPDQGIWIFEEITGTLLKLDTRLKSAAISVDLNQLLGRRPQPDLLLANQRWIILRDEGELLVFDQFGSRTRSLHIPANSRILQLDGDYLYYEENEKAVAHSLSYNLNKAIDQNCPPEAEVFRIHEQKCWYMTKNELVFPALRY